MLIQTFKYTKLVRSFFTVFFLLVFFLVYCISLAPLAFSQTELIVPPDTIGFLGQKHDYTVTLRGNGEAVISLRVVLTNQKDEELKELSITLPSGVNTSSPAVFQVIRQDRPCIRYSEGKLRSPFDASPICEEYGEPDYYQPWGQNKYQKAVSELKGNDLKIILPIAIQKDKAGAFFVYLRASSYAARNIFGTYNFNFESFKVDDLIQSIQVGLNTDSDLVLKGARGKIDYAVDSARFTSAVGGDEKAIASPAIDNFYQQIGYGSIVKNASNLAPNESYKVSGSYAGNNLQLYGKEIAFGLAILFVGAFFVGITGRLIYKKITSSSQNIFLPVLGVSLISSVLIAFFTAFLIFIGKVFENLPFDYPFLGYSQFLWLIIAVIGFVVYAFLALGPAIFITLKKSLGWGLSALGLTILWLVILVFIFFAVSVLSGSRNDSFPPIIPYGVEPAYPRTLESEVKPANY